MINNKNFTNKELRACYGIGSRSILLQFFLFLFFSERFVNSKKRYTGNEDYSTSLDGLRHLSLLHSYSFVSLLLVSNVFAFGCLWFVTLIVNLLCETCKFSSTFSVKIATSEALKLFFWNHPLTLL